MRRVAIFISFLWAATLWIVTPSSAIEKRSDRLSDFLHLNESHVAYFHSMLSAEDIRKYASQVLFLSEKPIVSYSDLEITAKALQSSLKTISPEESQRRLTELRVFLISTQQLFNSSLLEDLEKFSSDVLFPYFITEIAQVDAYLEEVLLGGHDDSRRSYRILRLGLRALEIGLLNTVGSRSRHKLNHFSILDSDELESYKGFIPKSNSSEATNDDDGDTQATFAPAISTSSTLSELIRKRLKASEGDNELLNDEDGIPRRNVSAIPSSVNWLEKGAVGEVLQQGTCGGCWAFAATAVMRSRLVISGNGSMTLLSNQQLISCADASGCKGGNYVDAWDYVKAYGGVASNAAYGYESANQGGNTLPCDTSIKDRVVTVSGYSWAMKESNLMEELATGGPVAVAITTPSCFHSYAGGILMYKDCQCYPSPTQPLDHAVTLIGYGTSIDGVDYWLIQNSWGTNWGENGYVMLERDISGVGMCGILSQPAYPQIVSLSSECQRGDAPTYCEQAAQPMKYSNLNQTTGEPGDLCYENYGGAYGDGLCTPSDTDDIPVWAWVLIGVAVVIAVVLLFLLTAFCCNRYAPQNAWYNVFARPQPEGYQLLSEEDKAQGKAPPLPNNHPDAFGESSVGRT